MMIMQDRKKEKMEWKNLLARFELIINNIEKKRVAPSN